MHSLRTRHPLRLALGVAMLTLLGSAPGAIAAPHTWTAGVGPVASPPFKSELGGLAGGAVSLQRVLGAHWTAIGRLSYLRSGATAYAVVVPAQDQSLFSSPFGSRETEEHAAVGVGVRLYPERIANGLGGFFAEVSPQLVLDRTSHVEGAATALHPGLLLGAGFLIPAGNAAALEFAVHRFTSPGTAAGGRDVVWPESSGGRPSGSAADGVDTYLISAALMVGL